MSMHSIVLRNYILNQKRKSEYVLLLLLKNVVSLLSDLLQLLGGRSQQSGNGNKPAQPKGEMGPKKWSKSLGNTNDCDHKRIFVVKDSFNGLFRLGEHHQGESKLF